MSTSKAVLSGVLVSALTLSCFLWFFLQRNWSPGRSDPASPAVSGKRTDEFHLAPVESQLDLPRVSVLPDPPPRTEPEMAGDELPATLTGFMTIDGTPQDGGRIVFRAENGAWERTASITYNGGFRVNAVPASRLTLSFELPAQGERRLFVPSMEVLPEPGKVKELELHWKSTQVNLKVIGDSQHGNEAHVDIEGIRLLASLETNDKGRGSLTLVGTGRFSFTATQRSGMRGQAAIDLAGDEGLETVVILMGEDTSR